MVKQSKMHTLTNQFETLRMHDSKITALGEDYSNTNMVRKVLRSLHMRFSIEVTTIEETKDLESLKIHELIGSLKTFEMNLDEVKLNRIKCEKNITLQVVDKVSTSSSI
ncbi:molybdate transporter 1-like [Gossypium australe]|uniref:Molybdate transporter 1-like n=1 Tax=Gossypium australe TaxID=47621 RepID=A0A5B6UL79_9ROSI|nr:molybdate transporter 1-like [Gossypium australe]